LLNTSNHLLKGNRTEDTKLAIKRESTVAWLFGDGANWGIWNVEQRIRRLRVLNR